MPEITKIYTGKALATKQGDLDAYLASPALIEAVNLAFFLQRPLLLTGAPGIGKTRLAESVAYEWHHASEKDYKDYYFRWNIKSTSKFQEGIYTFDNLGRLLDVQAGEKNEIKTYIKLGPLGEAYTNSSEENPAILLIDEIDKATVDFPNDLLFELEDKKTFEIPETKEKVRSKPLLIIITSNEEKELSPAFLRRCIYHHIEFPDNDMLKDILNACNKIDKELIEKGIEVFSAIREKQKELESEKLVSTSELIDWLTYLSFLGKEKDQKETILQKLIEGEIPYHQALIKNKDDVSILSKTK